MLILIITLTSIFSVPAYCSSECFIPGKCSGTAYTVVEMSTVEECIWRCWESPICQWSSYDPNKDFCSYYQYHSECENIVYDLECPLCLTNAKDCQKGSESSKLFNIWMFKECPICF